MDCTSIRSLLNLTPIGELDGAERAALDNHLEGCPDCAALALGESRFDEAAAAAMQAVPIPAGLQARVLDRLAKQRRPRPWKWVAAAAAVLFSAGLGTYLALRSAPEFDIEQVVANVDATRPEDVESWFKDLSIPIALPRQFNFQMLEKYDTAQIQGRQVPHLVFYFRGDNEMRPAVAHVYVLSTSQFKIPTKAPPRVGTHTFDILSSDGDDFFFLVINTATTLHPFLLQSGV